MDEILRNTTNMSQLKCGNRISFLEILNVNRSNINEKFLFTTYINSKLLTRLSNIPYLIMLRFAFCKLFCNQAEIN